jgi:hypothetical protein
MYLFLMKTVILRTHKRTKSNSFSDALFWTLTVAPSVGMFSELATKPTKISNCIANSKFLVLLAS